MRVLILYQHIDSGAKVATDALLECLRREYPENTYDIYRQTSHRFTGKCSFLGNLLWSMLDFRNRINEAPHVDIIYTTMYVAIIAQCISNKHQIPSIFHLHGDHRFGELKKNTHPIFLLQAMYAGILAKAVLWLQQLAIQRSSRTVFVSESSKHEFVERYQLNHLLPKCSTIYNGVSLKKYAPIAKKKKHALKMKYNLHTPFVISYLGRIDEKKGIHHLIDSTEYIKLDCTFLIIYPTTKDRHSHAYLDHLKKMSRHSPSTVKFIEQPRHVEELYHISDCVVLLSNQEMLPLVMLESLACGIPFISTPVGGIPEVLSPFPQFILRSIQPMFVAKRIQQLLTLRESEKKILQRKERAVAREYSWEKSTAKLNQIFREFTQY